MVVLGALVKEDCSVESKARMGTIVKVTDLVLSNAGLKQAEVDIEQAKKRHAELNREYDPESNSVIRPGKVFSVRWQHDPTKITVSHVECPLLICYIIYLILFCTRSQVFFYL